MKAIRVGIVAVIMLTAFSSTAQELGLELSQACAAQGCFAGDEPGFPISIRSPGRYYLSSDLLVSQAGESAIQITSDNVYLNLNNFVINGRLACSGDPLTCPSDPPRSNGVTGTGITQNVTVEGGTVIGFGQWGVATDTAWRIRRISALRNVQLGIFVRRGSIVEDSLFAFNGGAGAQVGQLGTLLRSQSSNNLGAGITTFDTDPGNGGRGGATIRNVSVYGNAQNGVTDHGRAAISGTVVYGNDGYGILSVHGGTRMSGVRVFENTLEGVRSSGGEFFAAGGLPVTIRDSFIEGNNSGGDQLAGPGIQALEGTVCGSAGGCP